MNKIQVTISLLILSLVWVNWVNAGFSLTYSDEIKIEEKVEEKNTITNVKKANLLKKSINKYRNKLESYKQILKLDNDVTLNKTISELKMMENALGKIANINISKQAANDVIWSIIKNLKEFTSKTNNYIRPILKKHLDEVKNYKEKYVKTSNKLASIVDKIEDKFKLYFERTPKMSVLKKKAINKKVANMKEYATKLREIKDKSFNKKEDIKSDYNEYKKAIIKEYISIVKILK